MMGSRPGIGREVVDDRSGVFEVGNDLIDAVDAALGGAGRHVL